MRMHGAIFDVDGTLLDSMYINIGFITFYHYPWLSFSSIDFTGIVQYHSC